MGEIKISEMNADASVGGGELIAVSDASSPKRISVDNIKDYVVDSIEAIAAGGSVTGADSIFILQGGVLKPVDIDLIAQHAIDTVWGKAAESSPDSADILAIKDGGTTEKTVTLALLAEYVRATIEAAILDVSDLADGSGAIAATDYLLVTQGTTGKRVQISDLNSIIYASLDTYVTALNAVTVSADTDVFYCIQGGTEKKVTLAEISTYLGNPVSGPGSTTINGIPQWSNETGTLKDGLTVGTEIGAVGDNSSLATTMAVRQALTDFSGGEAGDIIVDSITDGVATLEDGSLTGLVALNNTLAAEIAQLETIGSTTISAAQWGYLGELDQSLITTASAVFAALTVNGNANITGTTTIAALSGSPSWLMSERTFYVASPSAGSLIFNSGSASMTGTSNTFFGVNAGVANSSGEKNVGIGNNALDANATGGSNVAIGFDAAGGATGDNSNNTLVGREAGYNCTSNDNTFLGYLAGRESTNGTQVGVGTRAMQANTSGERNMAIGYTALRWNQTGDRNTVIGYEAALSSSGNDISDNVLIGYRVGKVIESGANCNTIVGTRSADVMTTGADNTLLGCDAAGILETGTTNIVIGKNAAGTLTTGTDNIIIGTSADVSAAGATNELDIGGLIKGDLSGSIAWIDGKLGIGTSAVPHGGVGAAKLAIEGTDSNHTAGPDLQFTTSADDYPLVATHIYSHDNIVGMALDAYYNGGWKSSDAGSNFRHYKFSDVWRFEGSNGNAVEAAISWLTAFQIEADAEVLFSPSAARKFYARDSGLYINSSDDGYLDFTADTAFRFNTGNVGIGESSPSSILHVTDSTTVTRVEHTATDGYNSARFYENATLIGALQTIGSAFADADRRSNFEVLSNGQNIAFSTDLMSTLHMIISKTTGNVGIGTSDPGAKLDVHGNVIIGGGAAGTDYTLTFDGETNDGVLAWMEDEDYFQFNDDVFMPIGENVYFRSTSIGIGSDDGGMLDLKANSEIHININGDNVVLFDGPNIVDSMNGVVVHLIHTAAQAAGVGAALLFRGGYTDASEVTNGGGISLEKTNSTSGNYSFDLAFHTRDNGSPVTEAMRIANDGKVGINLSSSIGSYLTVNGDAVIGDGGTTNYAAFAADGELTLHGTARVKLELTKFNVVVGLGATSPDRETLPVGSGTSVIVDTIAFDPTGVGSDEEVDLVFHVPANADGTVDVSLHLMWCPDPNWSSGDYDWKIEYVVKAEGADRTTGSSTTITESVTPANATDFIETEFSSTIDAGPEEVIYCRLYLDKSESAADDDGHVTFIEMEYTSDKLGEAT